jgi:hypothetical protein
MQEKEFNSIGALTDRQLFGGRIAAKQIRAKRQLGLVATPLFSSLRFVGLTVVSIVSIFLLRGSG